jgi:hypothetical protein
VVATVVEERDLQASETLVIACQAAQLRGFFFFYPDDVWNGFCVPNYTVADPVEP